ncbi:MAG: hypothetical protein A2Y24_04725 [Clostridiales bacterium GWE2_32_10]|nr:MAG: hypothetical protein A2Y24_04725 [Clostridiales bacterium GWE2_32_10]
MIDFELSVGELETIQCKIIEVNTEMSKNMPYGIALTGEGLVNWLNSRFIPKNRVFVENILAALENNKEPRLLNLLSVTLGLSLTDDYWVVPYGNNYTWEKYNLFDNGFSETLSLVAFTGYNTKIKGLVSSPEPTTNGMLKKCWRRLKDTVELYKGGTEGFANSGNEPYSEYYAYQVAEAMGLYAVKYDLHKWKGTLCSTCELFTSKERSFVPAYLVYGDKKVPEILRNVANTPLYNELVDIMVFDTIIINADRHFNNFGFIRNNTTGEIEGLAPIFDNGISLLVYAMDSDFNDIDKYINSLDMTFAFINAGNLDDIKKLMTNEQKERVRKLIDFRFTKHKKYNLPDKRLQEINNLIRERARYLLK